MHTTRNTFLRAENVEIHIQMLAKILNPHYHVRSNLWVHHTQQHASNKTVFGTWSNCAAGTHLTGPSLQEVEVGPESRATGELKQPQVRTLIHKSVEHGCVHEEK